MEKLSTYAPDAAKQMTKPITECMRVLAHLETVRGNVKAFYDNLNTDDAQPSFLDLALNPGAELHRYTYSEAERELKKLLASVKGYANDLIAATYK
ncbi:MAG: hypothetical protein LBU48_03290 [Coriobacteriales bacterium]|nr:hypothetical protein [Coriobacteriales bacterium]